MSQFGGFGCRVVNVTVAAALLATSPAAISQAYPPDESGRTSTPPPCPPDSSPAYRERTRCTPPTGDSSTGTTEDDSDDDGGAIVPVVVGVGLVGLLAASLFGSGSNSRGNKLPDRDWLLKNGPQLPTSYPVGSFSVKGLAKNGWPIVLDFMPQPRTRTTLDVIFKKRKVSLVVDEDGMQGRRLVKLEMPGDGPAQGKPRPATYVLHSIFLDIRRSPAAGSGEIPAPVEIYGIGGGPRAVGSVAIENLTALPNIVRDGTPVRLAYAAKSPFNHTAQEILKYQNDGSKIVLKRILQMKADDVQVGVHGGHWNGRSQSNNARSSGLHRYQVRGWFTSDDNSWVGAIAPTLVTVQQ